MLSAGNGGRAGEVKVGAGECAHVAGESKGVFRARVQSRSLLRRCRRSI